MTQSYTTTCVKLSARWSFCSSGRHTPPFCTAVRQRYGNE